MRIIGHIEHPFLKITVFKTGDRVSVKFENEGYEQTFKFGSDERFESLEAVQRWADEALVEDVLRAMQHLHQARLAAAARAFPAETNSEFDEII